MAETIYESFCEIARRQPERTALMYPSGRQYVGITYAQLSRAVDAVAASLRARKIGKGDAIGILSDNRPEWVMADLAALKLGGIVVPIYQNLPAHSVRHILNETGVKVLFVDTRERASRIESVCRETRLRKGLVLFDDGAVAGELCGSRFDDMRKSPAAAPEGGLAGHSVEQGACPADGRGAAVATIVYTSGTSGEPRGVMLTHHNLLSNAQAAIRRFRVGPEDVLLSFLPLCHTFERTAGYYVILLAGGTIAYARNLTTVASDLRAVRPTLLITVPRPLEKAYAAAEAALAAGSAIKKTMVVWAVRNLNELANRVYRGKPIPLWLRLKCGLFGRRVAAEFHKMAGGRLRLIIAGGAPLDRKIAKVLSLLGFNIIEGYGLTETSPIVCCNLPDDNTLGTVGKPLDGVELRIADDGEILVRGSNVMKGYWRRPVETAEVIDREGWLHTGDQGRFDRRRNLIITGRIKEIIVTSYGKNIVPAPIEARIAKSRYIDQVLLFGDRKKHLVGLIVPNREAVGQYARQRSIAGEGYAALLSTPEIRGRIRREIEQQTACLPRHEVPKNFALLPAPFTAENGSLTPSLKPRRSQIAERYRILIHGLYERPGKSRSGSGSVPLDSDGNLERDE